MLLTPVFIGFGYVASVDSAAVWLRVASAAVFVWALFQIAGYLICVRFWSWMDGQINVPTLRQPNREMVLRSGTSVHLVEHGFAQTLEIRPSDSEPPQRLALNMFLSRRDVELWAAALQVACGSVGEDGAS